MIAAVGPSALWYLTRGAGAVALLALTASVVLGIVHADRRRPAGAPRMLVESAHRTISLLVLVVLAIHIATAVLDSYAPIRLVDAVVPLASAYRPIWVGFGALSFDLLIALTVTSLLRTRIGVRTWRAVHWLAYACWPVAVLHGLGTGSDTRTLWMLALTLGCVGAVAAAVLVRLAATGPEHRGLRGGLLATLVVAAAGLAVWLPQGPLAPGWSRRAGTPPTLLASATAAPAAPAAPAADPPRGPAAPPPFQARLAGTAHQGLAADGRGVVDLLLRLHGGGGGSLRVRLAGDTLQDGGLAMTSSAVTLRHDGSYAGRITTLSGSTLDALVGTSDGRALRLHVKLDLGGATVRGTVIGRPATGGHR